MIQAVIWDFDGTLAYTRDDVWESVKYAAKVCNGNFSESFIRDPSNLGKGMKEIFQEIIPYPGNDKFEKFVQENRIYYRTISNYPNTYLYPGIEEVLGWNRSKSIKNYIISLKPLEPLKRIIRMKNWESYFEGIFSTEELIEQQHTKAELIEYLVKEEKFSHENVIYIGDTFSDIVAANQTGIKSIGVTYGDGDVEKLRKENPTYTVHKAYQIRYVMEVEI